MSTPSRGQVYGGKGQAKILPSGDKGFLQGEDLGTVEKNTFQTKGFRNQFFISQSARRGPGCSIGSFQTKPLGLLHQAYQQFRRVSDLKG